MITFAVPVISTVKQTLQCVDLYVSHDVNVLKGTYGVQPGMAVSLWKKSVHRHVTLMKSGMNAVMAVLNVIVATHHQKDIVKIATVQKYVNQDVNVIKDTHVIIVLDTVFPRNNVLKVHGAPIMKHLWIV